MDIALERSVTCGENVLLCDGIKMANESERHTSLTPLEKQLLRRLAQGEVDKVIAQEIGGTEEQVAGQREALMQKLNIQYRFQLFAAVSRFASRPDKTLG